MKLSLTLLIFATVYAAADDDSSKRTTGSNSPNTRFFGGGGGLLGAGANLLNQALGGRPPIQGGLGGFGTQGFGQSGFGPGGFGNQGGFGQGGFGQAGLIGAQNQISSGCRYWCRTPQGQAYCCESSNQQQSFIGVKPGQCPPVRPFCPPTRNFGGPPRTCSNDGSCPGVDKCCFDECLREHVCKSPYGFGR